jgi:phage anti-repressor protein
MTNLNRDDRQQQPGGELIPLTFTDDGQQAVSGRTLHEFMEVQDKYPTWFKRVERYGFVAGQDFIAESRSNGGRGRATINHIMTMDMAKEVAMLQRTEKGRQARRYFIEVEKRAKAAIPALPDRRALAQMVIDAEDKARQSDEKLHKIAVAVRDILDEDTPAVESTPDATDTALFEIGSPRQDASRTPATFFIADYVAEYGLGASDSRRAVASLGMVASNEYERVHGCRPPRTERTVMGRKIAGNAYTDADRPMLDALWRRGYRMLGGAA